MTQAERDRILEARKRGAVLNTHTEIAAFLGRRESAPTPMVMRSTARAVGVPIPQSGTLVNCWSCDTPQRADAVRCTQCGALVAR